MKIVTSNIWIIWIAFLASTTAAASPKIAWYGTLADGLAEAERSNRPILLVAAAPQCRNVSGMW